MARAAIKTIEPEHDAIEDALESDASTGAIELLDALDEIRAAGTSDVDILVYRLGKGGVRGSWDFCTTLTPPIEIVDVMNHLREEYGSGDYGLRIRVNRKLKTTKYISIAANKSPTPSGLSGSSDIVGLLLSQANSSKSDMISMMTLMMTQSQAAAERQSEQQARAAEQQAAASQRSTELMVTMMTAMMGGREKMSEIIPMMVALQPKNDSGGMVEALTVLEKAKGLFGGGEEKGDSTQEMVANGVKLIGPALKGISDMVTSRRGDGQKVTLPGNDGEDGERPVALMLGGPASQELGAQFQATREKGGTGAFPILDLVRDDVNFFFVRNHDPEKAADMVYDTFEAHDVPEDDINALYLAAMSSPDWLGFFAAEGIDLRQRPQWAEQFITALGSIHTENSASLPSGGGEAGRETDTSGDGEPGEGGD